MKDLIESYNQAFYTVEGWDDPIRIGHIHAELEKLLSAHHMDSWAYLTACNPMSVSLPDQINQQRNQELRSLLTHHLILEGSGRDPDNQWPAEPSFLILGISLEDAIHLASHFGQMAIVFGKKDAPAELVITAST